MSATENYAEKRKYPRIPLSVQYSLDVEGQNHTGVTGNISMGGVYLRSISPPLQQSKTAKSAVVTLHLKPAPLNIACRIVYVGGGIIPNMEGVGIAFEDLSKATSTTLNGYIQSKL